MKCVANKYGFFKLFARFVLIFGLLLLVHVNVVSAAQRLGQFLSATPGDNDHPHNFSTNSKAAIHGVGEDRICVFCHTPHSSSAKGPLWNRNDPRGPNGDGTFPLYGENSGRLGEIFIDTIAAAQYGPGYGEYPNGASRLCLSCHDGVTAIGEVVNPGSGASPLGGLSSIVGETSDSSRFSIVDLDTAHPISFVYDGTVQTALNGLKGGGADYIWPLPDPAILDNSSRVQCTTCHDPHYDTRDAGYDLPMWRNYSGTDTTDYEATCDDCHTGGSSSPGLVRKPGIVDGVHPIP